MNKMIIGGLVGVVVLGAGYSLVSSNKEAEMTKMQMMEEEKMMMEKAEMEKMEEEKMMMEKAEMEKMEMEKKAMEEKAMMEGEAMMKKDEMMKDESKMIKDSAMMEEHETMSGEIMMKKGSYEVYSPEKLKMAEGGDVVLFFRASWCPSCRALDADIKANLGSIKEGLTILEVDYDTATELKKKYGVTTQHTLVQVDKDGNLISKWSGGGTLAALTAKVQ